MNKVICTLLLSGLLAGFYSCNNSVHKPEYRGLIADNGMVVSAHPEASEVGKRILENGGTAMDAACAVEFALSVVYPAAGNIGGGGFWIVRTADGDLAALDFREKAPGAAHRNMYLDDDEEVIRGSSTSTILASGIPGTVAGMAKGMEKFGTLPWADLLNPAIELAEKGFPLTASQARSLNGLKRSLITRNTWRTSFIRETLWQANDTLRQPELAETLKRIRDNGRDGFYKGETARLIVEQMEELDGLITIEDLAAYEAQWREPVVGNYNGYEFVSMPPPSSGGIALGQLFNIVAEYPLAEYGFHSIEAIHLMAEAERRVYADRAEWLGDDDYFDVPRKELLSPKYLKDRAGEIDMNKATNSEEVSAMQMIPEESEETTHYSIVDQWGNAVAATTTLNGGYGNRIMVKGAGFLLNNEMDDFSIKPGFPNVYGLIGGDANAIQAGKRMLSSMTPTIVNKDNELFMVVGSPGGSTIITSVFQTILNVVDFNMGMQEAVDASRFHHQCFPDQISVETDGLDSLTIVNLEAMGHKIKPRGKIGRVDAILVLDDGKLEAGADKRGDDAAKGH
ncbi:MAG: gamma-glutamyltransferase [Bacteroidetes bacterium]|jgi:gamma-glutamyltranspeptidase / glutathione hydrolase|nr:gamma-glutamyltransferase [Bacteroidota bacterium]MBT4399920.1 gamma-glutamyltransferase [Bacteroidota bacterium]MBT7093990.1 gamma-glutamyltransferase [Bacteroidota bacterium]